MGRDSCTARWDYEGVVKIHWCESCFGWHCKRQWLSSSESSATNFWLGGGEHVFVQADEFADRALMKMVTGTAQTVRIIQTSEDAGQELLG